MGVVTMEITIFLFIATVKDMEQLLWKLDPPLNSVPNPGVQIL